MRVVFACARTGGHINPAIALAKYIMKKEEDSKILFIGTTDGLENDLVPLSGFEIKHIRTGKLIRSLTLKNFTEIKNAIAGTYDAKKILKEFKPDIVIGTGGYVCYSVMKAAKKLKIPYALHESNAFPGISVKTLAKDAKKMFIGFEDARARLKNRENIVYTGTPVKFSKEEYMKLDEKECLKELNIDSSKKIILVTGGSQGARRFSEIILDYLKVYRDDDKVFVLVTGIKNYDEILKKKEEIEKENNISLDSYLRIEKFIYNMEKMYKIASLLITRSGAMTINEISIVNKPAILIPYPYATENHQFFNATVLKNKGMAEIIEEKDLEIKLLRDNIIKIFNNYENYKVTLETNSVTPEEIIYNNIVEVINK